MCLRWLSQLIKPVRSGDRMCLIQTLSQSSGCASGFLIKSRAFGDDTRCSPDVPGRRRRRSGLLEGLNRQLFLGFCNVLVLARRAGNTDADYAYIPVIHVQNVFLILGLRNMIQSRSLIMKLQRIFTFHGWLADAALWNAAPVLTLNFLPCHAVCSLLINTAEVNYIRERRQDRNA